MRTKNGKQRCQFKSGISVYINSEQGDSTLFALAPNKFLNEILITLLAAASRL